MVRSEPNEKRETSNMADFNFEEFSDVFEDTQEPIDFEALSDIFEDTGVPTEEMAKESAMKARETSTATRSLTKEERAAKFPPVVQETIATEDRKGSEVGVMSAPKQSQMSVSKTTDVENLEGPEAMSSAVVQYLNNQTDTISRGSKGIEVFNSQLRLAELGYDIGRGGTTGLSKNKIGNWVSLDNSQMRGVDSDFGPLTEKAVKTFQKEAGLPITGEVDPTTARALASKNPVTFIVPKNFTKNFSNVQITNFNAVKDAAVKAGLKGAELASFMSQVAHESDSFKTTKEYASGSAYEGRSDLGNTQQGDGVRYKGRGYIQLTGRSNYNKAGKALNLDLVNNPSLAEDPKNASAISLWFWKTEVKPQIPDFMDTERVTKVVNGGFNGLKDRKDYFDKFTKKWNEVK